MVSSNAGSHKYNSSVSALGEVLPPQCLFQRHIPNVDNVTKIDSVTDTIFIPAGGKALINISNELSRGAQSMAKDITLPHDALNGNS